MRYFITILAISAFALMAGTAQAYDDRFGPVDDTALPAQSDNTLGDGNFSRVSWVIDFKTAKVYPEGQTIVLVKIDDTNVQGDSSPDEEWIDSDDYEPAYIGSKSGSDSIAGKLLRGRMVCHPTICQEGHFLSMYLGYTRYTP